MTKDQAEFIRYVYEDINATTRWNVPNGMVTIFNKKMQMTFQMTPSGVFFGGSIYNFEQAKTLVEGEPAFQYGGGIACIASSPIIDPLENLNLRLAISPPSGSKKG
jgi:hypothetical protein